MSVRAVGSNVRKEFEAGFRMTMRLRELDDRPVRFARQQGSFASLERWQINYLPVYAIWAALVVVMFPPLFGYR